MKARANATGTGERVFKRATTRVLCTTDVNTVVRFQLGLSGQARVSLTNRAIQKQFGWKGTKFWLLMREM